MGFRDALRERIIGDRPRAVVLSLVVLGVTALPLVLIVPPLLLLALFTGDTMGAALALVAALFLALPGLPSLLLMRSLARGAPTACRLATWVHGLLAAALLGGLVAFFYGDSVAPSRFLGIRAEDLLELAFFLAWIALAIAHLLAARGLARASTREWYGLDPLPAFELR